VGREMRKFFISYTSSDSGKAKWIGWALKDLGHESFVHEWEISGGQSIPGWMEKRMEECDHLIGLFSPDYIYAKYSISERLAAFWNDPDGRTGFCLPVVIHPCKLPKMVQPLKRLDLTGCDKSEARSRLEAFITPPAAPDSEPPFEVAPKSGHATEPEPPFDSKAATGDHDRFQTNRLPTPHSFDLIGRSAEKNARNVTFWR